MRSDVGRAGLEPGPTDYESPIRHGRDQAKRLAETAKIAWTTPDLAVASTVPVRIRYGYKSPSVAGVTPG